VTLVDEQKGLSVDRRRLRRLVRSTLRGEKVRRAAEVTVVVSGDTRLSELCRRFLGRARRTDVLAFAGGGRSAEPGARDLGEVVVNADRARREARRRRIDPEAELFLYVVHGLLHLVGYDDRAEEDARRMRAREAAVLRRFGYPSVFDAPVVRATCGAAAPGCQQTAGD